MNVGTKHTQTVETFHLGNMFQEMAALDEWSISYCFIGCHQPQHYLPSDCDYIFSEAEAWHLIVPRWQKLGRKQQAAHLWPLNPSGTVGAISDVTGIAHQMQWAKTNKQKNTHSVTSPIKVCALTVQPLAFRNAAKSRTPDMTMATSGYSRPVLIPLFTHIIPQCRPTEVNSAQPPQTKRCPS